jgi:hypothetical protein
LVPWELVSGVSFVCRRQLGIFHEETTAVQKKDCRTGQRGKFSLDLVAVAEESNRDFRSEMAIYLDLS